MKLSPKAFERLIQTDARFNRFDEKFKQFVEELTFFSEPRCPLKGVVIEEASDGRTFTVKYKTVTLTLRMLFQLNEQNSPAARVEVLLDKPGDSKVTEKLGEFTFNPQGFTNFEPDPDGDPVDLGGNALEILVHFLILALRHGAA